MDQGRFFSLIPGLASYQLKKLLVDLEDEILQEQKPIAVCQDVFTQEKESPERRHIMQVNRVLFCSLMVLVAIASCAPVPPVDTAAEAKAIHELSRRWNEAVIAKDIEAATSYFAIDGMLMPQNAEVLVGREAIRQWFEGWATDPNISNSFKGDVVEVASSGDIAYERGTYRFAMETAEGPIEDEGKYVVIWKKVEGEWKAILDISNSSLPLP